MGFFEDNLDAGMRDTQRVMAKHGLAYEDARKVVMQVTFYRDYLTTEQNQEIEDEFYAKQVEIFKQQSEIAQLRNIISLCAKAIDAHCDPKASIEFMALVPVEISAHLAIIETGKV